MRGGPTTGRAGTAAACQIHPKSKTQRWEENVLTLKLGGDPTLAAMATGLWCVCKLGKEGILALKVCPHLSTQGLTFGMLSLLLKCQGCNKAPQTADHMLRQVFKGKPGLPFCLSNVIDQGCCEFLEIGGVDVRLNKVLSRMRGRRTE